MSALLLGLALLLAAPAPCAENAGGDPPKRKAVAGVRGPIEAAPAAAARAEEARAEGQACRFPRLGAGVWRLCSACKPQAWRCMTSAGIILKQERLKTPR